MPKIAVLTVSDRVATGRRSDISGPLAAELLSEFGVVSEVLVVPDGFDEVQAGIHRLASRNAEVIFTTGGTGVTSRDQTPEATEDLLTQRMFGVENLLRSNPNVPSAALSRGVAGIAHIGGRPIFIVNAPGSQGGVKDAVRAIGPLLEHILSQMHDGDHEDWESAHASATRKIQNRGVNDGSDAQVAIAGVTEEVIIVDELTTLVSDRTAGAVVSFCGQVRDHDESRSVIAIDYQAHPDAGAVVERIAQEVVRSSGACKIAVLHRTGHMVVGDVALGAAVSASHRAEAFRLLEQLIEQVKMQLPVWKCQYFADGTKEWTGAA